MSEVDELKDTIGKLKQAKKEADEKVRAAIDKVRQTRQAQTG